MCTGICLGDVHRTELTLQMYSDQLLLLGTVTVEALHNRKKNNLELLAADVKGRAGWQLFSWTGQAFVQSTLLCPVNHTLLMQCSQSTQKSSRMDYGP